MNKPNQVVPSFVSVYLLESQLMGGASYTPILFNIIETDGTTPKIYDSTTGEFTAPVSGWFDLDVQIISNVVLAGVRIIKNGDTNFPIMGRVPIDTEVNMRVRVKLGFGETLRIEAINGIILALSGTTPDSRASNTIFTLVKRFDDTKSF
jgi:hypothetical protein